MAIFISGFLDSGGLGYRHYVGNSWNLLEAWGWDRYIASPGIGEDSSLDLRMRPPGVLPPVDLWVPEIQPAWSGEFGPSLEVTVPLASDKSFTVSEAVSIPKDLFPAVSPYSESFVIQNALDKCLTIPSKFELDVSKLDWQNTLDTPIFNMLISRMFSDS